MDAIRVDTAGPAQPQRVSGSPRQPPVDASVVREIAIDQLGGWRHCMRGELRALPRFVNPGESIMSLAGGSIGVWRGRVLVATDRRLLLVSKWYLRRARYVEIPYERIRSISVTPEGSFWRVAVDSGGESLVLTLLKREWVDLFARVVGERIGANRASVDLGSNATPSCEDTLSPVSLLPLPLHLALLAVLVLYAVDVLGAGPALPIFLMLALALAVVELRSGEEPLRVALGGAATVAIGLWLFEVLSFGLGLLLAAAAWTAALAVRRRAGREPDPRRS